MPRHSVTYFYTLSMASDDELESLSGTTVLASESSSTAGIIMVDSEGPPVEPPLYGKCSIINIPLHKLRNRTNINFLLLVYYKVFDEKGPSKVRDPIYFNNPYIGRVDANDIPPPHNASSLVGVICAKEKRGFGFDEDGNAYSTELFEKTSRRF